MKTTCLQCKQEIESVLGPVLCDECRKENHNRVMKNLKVEADHNNESYRNNQIEFNDIGDDRTVIDNHFLSIGER